MNQPLSANVKWKRNISCFVPAGDESSQKWSLLLIKRVLYQSTHGFTSRPSVGYDLLNRSWRVCEVMERNSTNRPREKNGTRIVVSKDFLLRHSSRRFFHINSLYLAKSLALAIVERMALHTTTPRNEELHGIVYEWENYASDPQKYLFCFAFATPFPLCQLITVGPLDF